MTRKNDDRVTPVGKVIRNIHFDELPQLFNILRGDMSFVGPRPECPVLAEEYRQTIPEFNYRLKVKAGLTGYAQVYGKYNTTPYDKLKLDLYYIENYSFWLDVKLILPGIPDKKSPYALAKTHYIGLMDSGVRIYEYSPGFVHAKSVVCDDREAVVGTVNLDYRSLYHHFECAAYMFETACIPDIELDFQQTLKKCRRVTRETLKAEKKSMKLLGCVMKALAPLL